MNTLNGSTVSDLILFGVVALIGINHVLMRIPGFIHRWWAFLPVQILNLGAAVWLMAVGVPEFNEDGGLSFLNWVLGLLLIFHIVQNNMRLQRAQRNKGRPSPSDIRAEQARIEEALRKGEESAATLDGAAPSQPETKS